jgi:FixJ family two-component response regulator
VKNNVVLVDDDRRIRESIRSVMESAGHATSVFSTAEEFLQSGELSETGCLIADMRLPGIDGLELQRHLRVACPELPIVFISAHQDDDVLRRALAGGALMFLHKPFDAAELLRTVDRALSRAPRSRHSAKRRQASHD